MDIENKKTQGNSEGGNKRGKVDYGTKTVKKKAE